VAGFQLSFTGRFWVSPNTWLAEMNVSPIQISLDGPADVHNLIRGNPQSFEKAVTAIEALKRQSKITVGVSTTVMPHNLESLPVIKDLLIPLKVGFWSLGIVMPVGRAKNNPALFLSPEQFGRLMSFIQKAKREIHIEFTENFPYLGKLDPQIRNSPKLCPAGILSCCIGVDGKVRGCSDQEDSDLYWEGNLCQQSFQDIWQRGFRRYRNQDKEKCRGGCWVMREKNLHCYVNYLG
jgi:MoaA/NifB/PqqE/SkfB family radical SAM enzyme